MHQLLYELKSLTQRHKEGSYATRANRQAMLWQMGEQLLAAGFNTLHAYELKGRHVNALLRQWEADHLSSATRKNRLAVLRWWAMKVGNPGLLKPTNAAYGIAQRQTVARTSKARALPGEKLSLVRDPYVRMSLQLQRAFGLRREEAIKMKPHQADHGGTLVLQASWTKGGRSREVPILTDEQRLVLDTAKRLVRFQEASLIPKGKRYIDQVHTYTTQCARAGLDKMHGLRHQYAQARYNTLTGFACSVLGGPQRQERTPEQQELDQEARSIISRELGHGREAITAAYLGR